MSADGVLIDSLYWELALDPTGVTQGANQAQSSIDKLGASAVALQQRFQQIEADITQASADFKRGAISAEDYATALKVARAEAQSLAPAVNQVGAGVGDLNRVLAATEPAANRTTQGLQQAGRGMSVLAIQAIGGSSAVAQLAQGLLVFAGGTGVAAGILAGIAAIAGAYELLTGQIRATEKAADEAVKSLLASTIGTLENQLLSLDARIEDLNKKAAEFNPFSPGAVIRGAVDDVKLKFGGILPEDKQKELADLEIARDKAKRELDDLHAQATDQRLQGLAQLAASGKATEGQLAELAAGENALKAVMADSTKTIKQRTAAQIELNNLTKRDTHATDESKKFAESFAQENQALLAKLSGSVVDQAVAQLEAFLAKYSKAVGHFTEAERATANGIIAELERQIAAIKSNATGGGIFREVIGRQGATPEEEHALIDAANRGGGAITGTGSGGPKPEVIAKVNDGLSKQVQLIAQASRGVLELANAFGLVGDNAARGVQGAVALADASARLADAAAAAAKASESIATGDLISGVLGIAGGLAAILSSLFGESPADKARAAVIQSNTDALKELTRKYDSFANPSTGFQQTQSEAGVRALLSGDIRLPERPKQSNQLDLPAVNTLLAGVGTTLEDLIAEAKVFGVTIDTSSLSAFTASLKAFQDALDQADKTRFLDSFTGQMQALNDHFAVFNITDPVEKLKEIMQVLGNPPRQVKVTTPDGKTHLVDAGGHGSSAIADALGGLDLGNAGDRAKALTKIEDLLTALTKGQIDAEARGGLSSKDFEQELLQLSGLLRDANAQIGGQSKSFAVDRTITEVTGSQIRALMDTQRLYQQNLTVLPEIRDLLAGRFSGAISAPAFPSLASAPGGLTVVIQAGAFPLTIVVPAGADGAAIGTAAAQAQLAALDRALGQRGATKAAVSGSVLQ